MKTDWKETMRVRPHSSLRDWRMNMGFDQRTAAAFLGISQAYYSKLEQRRCSPRPVMAARLRTRTGVPLDVLMRIAA